MTGEAVHIDRTGQAVRLQVLGTPQSPAPGRRADARRNRAKIVDAARSAFEEGGETSMAAVARRAGVGMATLYRNFPSRGELLEAVYADEVAAVSEAAHAAAEKADPAAALHDWLWRFFTFARTKHEVAAELLAQAHSGGAAAGEGRAAVLDATRPLLTCVQQGGEARDDLTLEQMLDMVVAIAAIGGPTSYVQPIMQTALDGLFRPPGQR